MNALTKSRESPLHFVAVYDRYQTAIMLINAGADIEITDDQKETPLHEATAYDALGVVQVDKDSQSHKTWEAPLVGHFYAF